MDPDKSNSPIKKSRYMLLTKQNSKQKCNCTFQKSLGKKLSNSTIKLEELDNWWIPDKSSLENQLRSTELGLKKKLRHRAMILIKPKKSKQKCSTFQKSPLREFEQFHNQVEFQGLKNPGSSIGRLIDLETLETSKVPFLLPNRTPTQWSLEFL